MQDDTIHILINKEEKEMLKRKSREKGISMSKYIRTKLLKNYYNM